MRMVLTVIFFRVKPYLWLFSPFVLFSGFLFIFLYPNSIFYELIYLDQFFINIDKVRFWFTALTLWAGLSARIAHNLKYKIKIFNIKHEYIFWLVVVLIICFNSLNIIMFYFFFELSLVPIMLLILGWGYQPERIFASFRLVFYTFIASLPLFLSIIILRAVFLSSRILFLETSEFIFSFKINSFISLFLILGFLVKLPVFLLHLWLPRAHVEAPVEGSMTLAAVILKLGGYGVLRVAPIIRTNQRVVDILTPLILRGGAIVSFICLRQTDLKTLIAYSSISHIAIAVGASMTIKQLSLWASTAAYISHGFVSSRLFLGANYLYVRLATRNLFIIKGALSRIPLFSFFWFVFCIGNMGTPPTPNFVREVFIITILLSFTKRRGLTIFFITFLATAFTINIFLLTQHSKSRLTQELSAPVSVLESVRITTHFIFIFFGGVFVLLII